MDTFILAAGAASVDTNTFWNTQIGGAIKAVMVAIGIVVVLVCALKALKDVTGGKPGNAAKTVIAGAVLASVLFYPEIISDLIGLMGDLFQKVISSVKQLTGSAPAAPGAPTP